MKVIMEREGPSAQQKQTPTTKLVTPTSFAAGKPLEGWALLFCNLEKERNSTSLYLEIQNNTTYFHSLHKLIMFSSLLTLREGGWSKLIWY